MVGLRLPEGGRGRGALATAIAGADQVGLLPQGVGTITALSRQWLFWALMTRGCVSAPSQAASVVEAYRGAMASSSFGPDLVHWDGPRMRLVDPDGFLVCSNVIAELFAALATVPCLATEA